MSGQLIPAPELGHVLPGGLSQAEYVAIYLDLLEASEEMLIAGLTTTLRVAGRLERCLSGRGCAGHVRSGSVRRRSAMIA